MGAIPHEGEANPDGHSWHLGVRLRPNGQYGFLAADYMSCAATHSIARAG